jgi:transcriptional regulator with GAF, ATPase, and Fis domain
MLLVPRPPRFRPGSLDRQRRSRPSCRSRLVLISRDLRLDPGPDQKFRRRGSLRPNPLKVRSHISEHRKLNSIRAVSLISPRRRHVGSRSFIDFKPSNKAKAEVSVQKHLASRRGTAQELLEVQSVNGFHPDVESQSTIHSNGTSLDHGAMPAQLARREAFAPIIYVSRAMGEILNRIECARGSSAPTLITGETGTGKELIARAVHAASPRHGREFIPFNCGDVGPELIVSELFGHRRGAFTGAERDSKGVVFTAIGGTLFLDEIGELPLVAQAIFLRFLQEGEIRPLGETRPIKVNVRVIAATNRDLEADVQSGRFRADLFERLNKLRLRIPPLRERREDVPHLIKHFLHRYTQEMGKQVLRLSAEAWNALLDYDWRHNVRELENVLYRLVAFAKGHEEIGLERVLEEIEGCAQTPAEVIVEGKIMIDRRLTYRERKDELARLSIIEVLNETGGNLSRAATRLRIHRDSLRRMIDRLKIKIDKRRLRK